MAVQQILDLTNEYASGSQSGTPGLIKLDTGGYDYAIVQIINPAGTISFKHTIDSGDIQGVSDGSAISSSNAVTLQGINLANGAGVTSVNFESIIKFESFGRFLWIDGTSEEGPFVANIIVRLYKIH